MKRIVIGCTVAFASAAFNAIAFEVKGYTPGVDISTVDTSGCKPVASMESGYGMPGFLCNTTLGGEKAELRLSVFDKKVAEIMFIVSKGQSEPIRDALVQKYGAPSIESRGSSEVIWLDRKKKMNLSIINHRIGGYGVIVSDETLEKKAKAAAAAKAKKDL